MNAILGGTAAEYVNVDKDTWLAAMEALQSGDADARDSAYTSLLAAAPPSWVGELRDPDPDDGPGSDG